MFAHFTGFQKCRTRVSGKVECLLSQLKPFFDSGFGGAQVFFALADFDLQCVFLFDKGFVVDKLAVSHLGEFIQLFLGFGQIAVLHLVNLGAVFYFRVVLFVQTFQRPFQKLWQYRIFLDFLLNSHFQILNRYAFPLIAFDFYRFSCAVIVSVFFYLPRAFNEFLFHLGGIQTSANPASYGSRKGECSGFRARSAFSAKQHLRSVVFLKGDHFFVLPLVLLTVNFDDSSVKLVRQDFIDSASRQWITAHSFEFSRTEAPFFVYFFQNFWRSVVSSKHQIPHFSNEIEPFGIYDDGFVFFIVQIAQRRDSVLPALFQFALQSSLGVFAQIQNVLVGHIAFHAEQKNVILREILAVYGLN